MSGKVYKHIKTWHKDIKTHVHTQTYTQSVAHLSGTWANTPVRNTVEWSWKGIVLVFYYIFYFLLLYTFHYLPLSDIFRSDPIFPSCIFLSSDIHNLWKSPDQYRCVSLICLPTSWRLTRLSHLSNNVSPLADDEDRKLQHSSLRRAAAIHVVLTALPLHPWGRLSPISALNNGFRFLFILPLTVSLSFPFSVTATWLALILIIAVGHHKKGCYRNNQGLDR